jgi:hypothetical protein
MDRERWSYLGRATATGLGHSAVTLAKVAGFILIAVALWPILLLVETYGLYLVQLVWIAFWVVAPIVAIGAVAVAGVKWAIGKFRRRS